MKRKIDPDDIDREAAALQDLFGDRNRAEFARVHQIPGGWSMVSQHLHGRRPISLEQGIAYAEGFQVTLDRISPRLVALVQRAMATLPAAQAADNLLSFAESAPPRYADRWPFRSVSQDQWQRLRLDQRDLVEGVITQITPSLETRELRAQA